LALAGQQQQVFNEAPTVSTGLHLQLEDFLHSAVE
jgi:hypothetical protein